MAASSVPGSHAAREPRGATRALVLDASCDPVGRNPFGEQFFSMRADGSGLRQLTSLRGMEVDPDGTVRVELPGPAFYSTPLR